MPLKLRYMGEQTRTNFRRIISQPCKKLQTTPQRVVMDMVAVLEALEVDIEETVEVAQTIKAICLSMTTVESLVISSVFAGPALQMGTVAKYKSSLGATTQDTEEGAVIHASAFNPGIEIDQIAHYFSNTRQTIIWVATGTKTELKVMEKMNLTPSQPTLQVVHPSMSHRDTSVQTWSSSRRKKNLRALRRSLGIIISLTPNMLINSGGTHNFFHSNSSFSNCERIETETVRAAFSKKNNNSVWYGFP